MSSKVLIGTAGWSYLHWNGVVYPASSGTGFHPLELVARHTDTVEINSSFYQHLKPEVVKLWAKKVSRNPNFLFTAKLHQQFTHQRILERSRCGCLQRGAVPAAAGRKARRAVATIPYGLIDLRKRTATSSLGSGGPSTSFPCWRKCATVAGWRRKRRECFSTTKWASATSISLPTLERCHLLHF